MKRAVAKRIRNGTNPSNTFSGVITSRMPPSRPPTRLTGPKSLSQCATAGIFPRYPAALAIVAGIRAMVLVAFAPMDGIPTRMRVGKVTRVPPPAMAFMMPATQPAAIRRAAWPNDRTSMCGVAPEGNDLL